MHVHFSFKKKLGLVLLIQHKKSMPTNGQKLSIFCIIQICSCLIVQLTETHQCYETKLDTKIPSSQIQKLGLFILFNRVLRVDRMVMVLIWNPHVSGLYAKRTWMKYYFLYVIKRNEGNSIIVP